MRLLLAPGKHAAALASRCACATAQLDPQASPAHDMLVFTQVIMSTQKLESRAGPCKNGLPAV